MVTIAVLTENTKADRLAQEIARDLVRAEADGVEVQVSLPVLYPSGNWVTVRALANGTRFLVTDEGDAAREADLAGASAGYVRIARKVADRYGLRFVKGDAFEAEASRDQLIGLIIVMAGAMQEAVRKSLENLADRLGQDASASLRGVLTEAFGAPAVSFDVEYVASSSHRWSFDALVETRERPILVGLVSPAAPSVFAAFAKFDDLRRCEDAPKGVAAISARNQYKEHQIILLNRTAQILEVDAPVEVWRRLVP